MWRTTGILIVSLILAANAAQAGWFGRGVRGTGEMVTESRHVGAFDRIRTAGSWDVSVIVGQEQSVKLTFDDNIIELIRTEVDDGALEIFSNESFSTKHRCRVEITVPALHEIRSSGSGDISVDCLDTDSFDFDLAGSGDFDLNGKAREMRVRLAGSGDGSLTGEAGIIDVKVSGSGDVDARGLEARQAIVRISGSGDVAVHCSELFDGRVSGSGDIVYYGKPADVNMSVSGSGDIRRR